MEENMTEIKEPHRVMFTCDICRLTLSSTRNLHRHRRKHGVHEHACHVCGKSFSRKDNMIKHVISVHIRRQLTEFPCPVFGCDVRTKSYQQMQIHMEDHNLIAGNYAQCKLCPASFYSAPKLLIHFLFDHDIANLGELRSNEMKLEKRIKPETSSDGEKPALLSNSPAMLPRATSELSNAKSAQRLFAKILEAQETIKKGLTIESRQDCSRPDGKAIQDFSSLLSMFSTSLGGHFLGTSRPHPSSPGVSPPNQPPASSKSEAIGKIPDSKPVKKNSPSFTISSILSDDTPSSKLSASAGSTQVGHSETSWWFNPTFPSANSQLPLLCGSCEYVTNNTFVLVSHIITTKHF